MTEQEYQFGDNGHGPDIGFIRAAKEAALDWDRREEPFVPPADSGISSAVGATVRLGLGLRRK